MKPIITNYNEETGDFRVVTPVPFTLKDGIEYVDMVVADIPKYEDIKDYNVFDLIRENQELKQDIKNLVNVINKNCVELSTTNAEYESLKRWNK